MTHCTERVRIVWRPQWGNEYEKWAAKFVRKNLWRCDCVHDFEDMMQEAYLTFVRIADTYPRVIDPKNFMALFKMAMTNKMHDRSLYKKRRNAAEVVLSMDVSEFFTGRIGEMTNAGYLAALINEAPEELKLALATLAKGLPEKKKSKPGSLKPRKNLSMQVAEALNLGPKADPLTQLKKLLTE